MGPNVEPCAIPDESIFTPCFLCFKYECTKVTASLKNRMYEVLQQVNHEYNSQKSWRDLRTVPTKFLLSRDFFRFSK